MGLEGGIKSGPCGKGGRLAGGGLRVDRIKPDQPIGQQRIACPIGAVKRPMVARQRPQSGAETIGVFPRKIGVLGQRLAYLDRLCGRRHGHLQGKPFIDHQTIMLPLAVKGLVSR